MRKFLFLLSWVAVTIAMTGCSTYYGYESSQETEDVYKSDKILASQLKGHSLNINGKRLKLTANYDEKHEKQVKHYEVRKYIYLKGENNFLVITSIFSIIRGVLFDLLSCSGDWHLASNPPNFFRRITYVPPLSWFFPLVDPPYYNDPSEFSEGEKIRGVYKIIERERRNESIKNTVYNIETGSVVKQGNIEIEIAGKTTVLNLAAPVIKVNMLPIKPLPPKSIYARSKYKKTFCDFKINTLEILDSQSQMAWKNFQSKTDVNSLLFLLKHKLIGDKDFNDLLSGKIEKFTINDMITLKKSSNLAPRVLSKLNQKLEKIARLKAAKEAKIKKYKYPYADKYPFALKLTDKWSSGASYEWFLRENDEDLDYDNKYSIYIKEISKNPKIVLYSNVQRLRKKNDRVFFIFGVPSVEDLERAFLRFGWRSVKSKDQPVLIGTSTRVKDIPIEKILKSLESKYGEFTKTTNKVSYLLMGSKCQVNANTSSWVHKSDNMYIIVNSNKILNATVADLTDADLIEEWEKITWATEYQYGKYSEALLHCKRTFNPKDRRNIARLINERKFKQLDKNDLYLAGIKENVEPNSLSRFSGAPIFSGDAKIVSTDNLIQVIKLDYKMSKDFSNAVRKDVNKYRKAKELKEKKKEKIILNNL